MTRPPIQSKNDSLDPDQGEILSLYREAAEPDAPSPKLDCLILDAARADLKSEKSLKSGRQHSWIKRWLPAMSAVAVAVLGLSISLRVMERPESDRAETFGAGSAPSSDSKPTGNAPTPSAPLQDKAAAQQNLPAIVAEPRASPARPATARAVAKQAPSAAASPAPPAELSKKTQKFDAYERQEERQKDNAGAAASLQSAPLGKLEAKRRDGESTSLSAGSRTATSTLQPADDTAAPEAWLRQIRELRAAGRNAEADRSLERFRERYPSFVVPVDLSRPK